MLTIDMPEGTIPGRKVGDAAVTPLDASGIRSVAELDEWIGSLNLADAFRFTKPFTPAQGLYAELTGGRTSTSIVCLSDSTANDAGEWFDLLATWLAGLGPSWSSALKTTFDDAAQAYAAPTLIRAGDGSGPVVLADTFTRADGAAGEAESSTNGAQVWVGGAVAAGQLNPGGGCTIHTWAPDYDGQADFIVQAGLDVRILMRYLDGSNYVFLQITAAGGMNLFKRVGAVNTLLATVPLGALTPGQTYHVSFSCSGLRYSGTALGKTVTGYITPTELATFGLTNDNLGLSAPGSSSGRFDSLVVTAAPTFTALNGAVGGKNLAYDYDTTRFPKLVPFAPSLAVVSHSHNEGLATNDASWSTMRAKILAVYPGTPIAWSTQNPETTNRGEPWHEQAHAARQPIIRSFAYKNGDGLIDAHARFRADQPALNETHYMLGDGTHPKAAGSQAWFNEAKRLFGVVDPGTT